MQRRGSAEESLDMRVVHYHPYMYARDSGTATAARGWAKAIKNLGVPVVAVLDREARHIATPDIEWIPLHHRLRGQTRVPVGLADHIDKSDVLVLHGGWLLRNSVAALWARQRAIPYVITAHSAYQPHVLARRPVSKRLWAATFERKQLSRALAVHLFFTQERDELERLRVRPRTIIAANGIDVPVDVAWDGGSGGYLLWLGRFDPDHKGLDLLLYGLQELEPGLRPKLRLHGPDWRGRKLSVARLVRQLHLEPWVVIGDPVYGEEKWELLKRAAGCVYPSRWEGCSVAVLESIAAGVPTLVAPYAQGEDLAADGAAVKVGWSATEVAQGLLRLMSPEAESIGTRASEVARARFSWRTVAESWLERVQELAAQARG